MALTSNVDITERDLDFLLAEELKCNEAFRCWLGRQVWEDQSPDVCPLIALSRSVATLHGESDLLLIHEAAKGERRAVMIENKVAAPFMLRQADRYRLRGEAGVETGEWDAFRTVLIAPKDRLSEAEAQLFDRRISYEACITALDGESDRAEFKRMLLRSACARAKTPWVRTTDDQLTVWFEQAWRYGAAVFPDLPLPPERQGRAPTSTWMTCALQDLPRSRVVLEIKPHTGTVDLRFYGVTLGDMRRALDRFLPTGAQTAEAKSGKSVSIQMTHPLVAVREPFEGQEARFYTLLDSANRLHQMARDRSEIILGMLGYRPRPLAG